jgi:HAD superfamily hydrolase (TIGR01549 family)
VLRRSLRAHGYPRPAAAHLREAIKTYCAVGQKYWHVEEDAAPALQILKDKGCRLGIISNAPDDNDVQTLVDNAHLRSFFDFVLTSARVKVRKPNPKIFRAALDYWGARQGQTVMVGDMVKADVAGANRLAIASVWIPRRTDTPENHAAALIDCPNATIYALSELPSLLESWPAGK